MSSAVQAKPAAEAQIAFSRPSPETLVLRLSGSWRMQDRLPSATEVEAQVTSAAKAQRVAFDSQGITAWDSGLLIFLRKVVELCERSNIEVEDPGLPAGVKRLLDLASAVPERKDARRQTTETTLLDQIGFMAIGFARSAPQMLGFVGEATLAFLRFLRGKARYRRSDLVITIQECGAEALPIVTLIGVLVGVILAFVGAVQLKQFGAEIFVANLVGLGMAREMGAMMTAVIMAGRTGAAFAAQLGTMRVNQEIDALTTLGIPPMEFLVLPRMLALMIMMPLLTIYADVLGILGGGLVGMGMLDLSFMEYYNQSKGAIKLSDFGVGLFKSAVFGALIAISGCLRGMQSGSSSAAVGLAATSAVVTAIVLIIVSDAIITVLTTILGV